MVLVGNLFSLSLDLIYSMFECRDQNELYVSCFQYMCEGEGALHFRARTDQNRKLKILSCNLIDVLSRRLVTRLTFSFCIFDFDGCQRIRLRHHASRYVITFLLVLHIKLLNAQWVLNQTIITAQFMFVLLAKLTSLAKSACRSFFYVFFAHSHFEINKTNVYLGQPLKLNHMEKP